MCNGNDEEELQANLQLVAIEVRRIAQTHQAEPLALLSLLRLLEALHREIRDGSFQEALPTNRQVLYNLLKDIEAEGGWPYISRMRLQSLLASIQLIDCPEDTS